MYSLHMKSWFSHFHPMYGFMERVDRVVHDRRFWGVLILVAFVAALMIFAIWMASMGSGESAGAIPYWPFEFPYPPYTFPR